MVNIVVDHDKCDGCGECISVCPAEVYELNDEGKSVPVRADDCEQCCSCVESCPNGAITVEGCE
ncbi:4Fe-4S binding protein [Archaeoglobus veneficus]|uniref:4Fe-4S ferredoxin iron-sulfur binding domain-containing protein n=1 Tax=Archaeoglobus veneficus (strain DSM 11195 / SNP6) TaxID=693661 RepID=F2KRS4_ARCVS|nr:4Fe-4S binding protein [Archaeoglobus veneficus]AEA47938.1 4Fe-4S ferredoxin iron-sulfur binding domain-containing protein [Archaeoglobus veneficus SNP6]